MSDLISRQAAIDALWKALSEYEDKTEKQFIERDDLDVGDWIQRRGFVQNMSDIDRRVIMNMPAACAFEGCPSVEPKTGVWLKAGQSFVDSHMFRNFFCSVCGHDLDEHIRIEPNYCPNCGAKMQR